MPTKKTGPDDEAKAADELNVAQQRWLKADAAAVEALQKLQDAEARLAEAKQASPPEG